MDRRTALFLTMLMGGLAPRGLLAQTTSRKASTKGRKSERVALEPVREQSSDEESTSEAHEASADDEEIPPNLPPEPGQQWKTFDISNYVSMATGKDHTAPQNSIVEWIFRRTTSAPWHGDKIAVLSASRTQLRVYNNAKILKQVSEIVERFTNATHNYISLHVQFIRAVDTRWRQNVYSQLTPVLSGPQGQQIWTLSAENTPYVQSQMLIYPGCVRLANTNVSIVNGQTITIKSTARQNYTGSVQRESAAGLGYQPRAETLEEGISLRISPLLAFDGEKIDAAIDLTANTVKNYHRTSVITPREVGTPEITIEVPEVAETRLNQTVKEWKLGQTLLISTGIHPGILQPKSGLFNNLRIPGTGPNNNEVMVFIEAQVVEREAPKLKRSKAKDEEVE